MTTPTKRLRPKKIGGYRYYKGYRIANCGYYPPDRCIWWEAVDEKTECADYHANTLREIIRLIDEEENKQPPQ